MSNLISDISNVYWQSVLSIDGLFSQGGPVLWLISSIALVLFILSAERFVYLHGAAKKVSLLAEERWIERPFKGGWAAYRIRDSILAKSKQNLNENISFIRTLVLVCPFFGLLGTVTGMISVFDVMAYSGTGDSRSMAAGISRATIPTMAGMMVAIIGLLLLARIERLAKRNYDRLAASLTL